MNDNYKNRTEDFSYVEFAAKYRPGFRNTFVKLVDVLDIAEYYRLIDVYTSMYLYGDDVLKYLQEKKSISGFQGLLFSFYLFFDVDNKDWRNSLKVSQQLLNFFFTSWDVCKEDVTLAFSGRGLHVGIQNSLFGIDKPSTDLNVVFDKLRREIVLVSDLENESSIDFAVGDRSRLWRLLNSINSKSGLYKIPVTSSEIFSFDTKQIKQLANKPRPAVSTDETGLIPLEISSPNDKAVAFYQEI